LVERDSQLDELRRQAESARADAEKSAATLQKSLKDAAASVAADLERDRAVFQKRLKEETEFKDRLSARIAELEKDVGGRDALIQAVRGENEALQKNLTELTAAKDAESRLMRENLQRLGRQNKELLTRLQEAAGAVPAPPVGKPDMGPVAGNFQDMLSSLEEALTQRDRVLEDQQKSLDEKRGLIEGLFNDLKSLDEQAVSLLEEKGRATQEMNEKISALTAENERLRRGLEAASAAAEAAQAQAAAQPASAPEPSAEPAPEAPAAAPETPPPAEP
jgi:chromosome segregation ATPase